LDDGHAGFGDFDLSFQYPHGRQKAHLEWGTG
jgi:hypothetical protein